MIVRRRQTLKPMYVASRRVVVILHVWPHHTRNSSGDEIANVNFPYDDIVQALQNTIGLLRRSRSSKVTEFDTNRKLICDFVLVIICPIAIAYSMGQIIRSVFLCQCICLSVRLRALSRSQFLIDFHHLSSLGVNIVPPIPLFCPQNSHFRPTGPENPCKYQVILYLP